MIIDDEEPARSELRFLLQQHPDVCVVCEAANYKEALVAIRSCQPHLVFLDIEMSGMSGINLAEKILENQEPLIVFATAHEEYAVKAFDLNAVDYMLKPFSPQRVAQCIDRVRGLMSAKAPVAVHNVEGCDPAIFSRCKLAIEHNGKAQIINTNDIIAVSSSDGHLVVHTRDKAYQANMTLQDLQARLDENVFFRCHRGFLVNLEKIREVIPWFNGTYNLIMEGLAGIEVPVSRQQAPKLKKIFSL
jgi:two-component system LytT family response regulator/two-component system response regulator LytT